MIKKLNAGHIRDLTTPRYVEEITERYDGKGEKVPCKMIMDTHCSIPRPITTCFGIDEDITEFVDNENTCYHNFVARHLGFDLTLGLVMQRINRSSW